MQKNKISPLKGEIFYVIPRRFVSGSPKDTCTFGEKEHASKRVSIIVPDNAISKTKRATRTRPRVNLQRTSKIHQILAFLGGNFFRGLWSPFYSALNIVFGAPAEYCVPVGIMVAFKRWDFFSKILAFSGRLFLCFFEYRNIMCAD